MSVVVYIWDNDRHTGHSSIQVNDGYLSHTPEDDGLSIVELINPFAEYPAERGAQVERDLRKHGRPTHVIEIDGLNEAAMQEALVEWDRHRQHYNLLFSNCSTAVAKLLLIGFAHQVTGIEEVDDLILLLRSGALTENLAQAHNPDLHERHLEGAFETFEGLSHYAIRATGHGRKFMMALLLADAGRRAFVWYPGRVLQLAKFIQNRSS